MKITSLFYKSVSANIVNNLFADSYILSFKKTFTGKLVLNICYVNLARGFLLFAIFLTWYEGFFGVYVNFISSGFWVLLFLFLGLFFSPLEKLKIKKIHLWYLSFLLMAAISGFISVVFLGINGQLILKGWLIFFQFGLTLILFQASFNFELLSKWLVYLSIPLLLVGFGQYVFGVETSRLWVSASESISTRSFAFFGSPNVLGVVCSIIFILSLFLSKIKNRYYLLAAILSLLVLFFTFSRSAWLGAFIPLLIVSFMINKRFIFLAAPVLFFVSLIPKVRQRFFIIFSPDYLHDATLDGRIWSYINGFYILKKFPLFGTGPGSYGGQLAISHTSPVYLEGIQNGYTALLYTDNQWLEILVQTGILGGLVFFGFVVSVFYLLISNFKQKKDIMYLGGMAVFGCFLIVGFFSNVLEFSAVALPVAAILGASLNEK